MRRRALLAGAALSGLGGCAAVQTDALTQAPPAGLAPRVELTATPFFAQTAYHCGPAALATVLAALGLPADPALLGEQVFLPARAGTLQIEMIAGARRQGAVATRLPGTLEALLRELQAGHAPVVLLNLGLGWAPVWHYAVPVGYDLARGEMLLRSGRTERAVFSLSVFERTWVRAGAWAFVATRPGDWPSTATEDAVVEAAVGVERSAAPAVAVPVYRSALARHPGRLSLQIGLGNALHAAGDRAAAAAAFEAAAQAHPDSAPAWLNLASTLSELGRPSEALAAAREAERRAAGGPWARAAADLLARLQSP
ncbi:PA2778 family cysteine peptidase [Piscinibacter defluvii]|uniref:PA2778 family cysteine peptidase n=1 Tax=Piscinibacter defluvii TaxID=1796922 RepID=UPI000FDE246D|nr:PA2778 family cysteine peptidase [Piscinibacter defluvii]